MKLSNETKQLLEKINAYLVLMGGTSVSVEELAELKFGEILAKMQPNGVHLDVACEHLYDTRKTSPWSLPVAPIIPFPSTPMVPDYPPPQAPTCPAWPEFPGFPLITYSMQEPG